MALEQVKIRPTGMRLHEWIALERGYFQEQGIEPEIQWYTMSKTMASWKGQDYLHRPQDEPFQTGEQLVTSACSWGSICNAAAGMGKFVPDAYGVARWAIYVRPDSRIQRPEDLADVPIAVGLRAGSHFNVPYRLEHIMPLDRIKTVNVGGFGARLSALLSGEVEAASLLDPQISMADELGLRRVISNRFKTLWVVPATADSGLLDAYFKVLQRADTDLDADPSSCLPLWRVSIPTEFQDRAWDYNRFDIGERFVYEPLERAEFEEILHAAQRWGLDDYMQARSYEELALPIAI